MQPGKKTTPHDKPKQSDQKEDAAWQFHEEDTAVDDSTPTLQNLAPVSWTASEFVSHEKNAGWYFLVVLGSAVLAAIVYFITRDMVSPVVIVIFGISFAAFGARKPQVLDYVVDNNGIHIGQKTYPYTLFRTFSVIEEDAVRSILLMPLQRFNLPINIYYDPADEEKIVEAIGAHLPHQDRQPAPIDNFMRKIRF